MSSEFQLAGLRPLTADEMQSLSGGTSIGPFGELLVHFLKRAVDCLIDDFDSLVDCFNEGREAAAS